MDGSLYLYMDGKQLLRLYIFLSISESYPSGITPSFTPSILHSSFIPSGPVSNMHFRHFCSLYISLRHFMIKSFCIVLFLLHFKNSILISSEILKNKTLAASIKCDGPAKDKSEALVSWWGKRVVIEMPYTERPPSLSTVWMKLCRCD